MNIDIKEIIEKVVDKVKDDPAMLAKFKKDPISVVEKLVGIDLPNDQLEKVGRCAGRPGRSVRQEIRKQKRTSEFSGVFFYARKIETL